MRCVATYYRFCLVLGLGIAYAFLPGAANLLADSFNWQSVNGYNWNSPIESQFGGTCWDFSACGTLEAKYMLTRNDPTFYADVSEQEVDWERSRHGQHRTAVGALRS